MLKLKHLTALLALVFSAAIGAEEAMLPLLDPIAPRFVTTDVDAPLKVKKFSELFPGGGGGKIDLSGITPEVYVPFHIRKDEIVTAAEITFQFTASPGALPANSHLNILLNGNLQKVLPIAQETLGKPVKVTVELDPLLISEYNQIGFQFVSNFQEVCGGQGNSSIWVKVATDGKLALRTQNLRVRNDLAMLPTPFIDVATPNMTRLPVVLPENPSIGFLDAAATFASWAGATADWRGVRFKVVHEAPVVESHFIVFATNDNKPNFLELPHFTEPTLLVMDAPFSTFAKVLVIGAENEKSLKTAALALSEATLSLGGEKTTVGALKPPKPRAPYDAPKWVDTTRPIYFRDLVDYPGQLTSEGIKPRPIHLNLKLPPDLFMVENTTIPLELKYRHTKPEGNAFSIMRFQLNGQLVESYPMKSTGNNHNITFTSLPVINSVLDRFNSTLVPAVVLNTHNTMTFDFQYGLNIEIGNREVCKSFQLVTQQVEIDPESKLDLTGFHHFTKMPDLNKFLTAGYPFSRYADLSDTAFVLPVKPTEAQIETLLQAVSRISSFTGFAAGRFTIHHQGDEDNYRLKNIIFISELPKGLRGGKNLEVAALVDETKSHFKYSSKGIEATNMPEASYRGKSEDEIPRALIVGFKSPFGPKLSTVALMANGNEASELMNDKLALPASMGRVFGAVAILGKDGDASFDGEEVYFVGNLPWYKRIWFELAERPLLLVSIALLSCLILAGASFSLLRRIMRQRVHTKERK